MIQTAPDKSITSLLDSDSATPAENKQAKGKVAKNKAYKCVVPEDLLSKRPYSALKVRLILIYTCI